MSERNSGTLLQLSRDASPAPQRVPGRGGKRHPGLNWLPHQAETVRAKGPVIQLIGSLRARQARPEAT